MEAVRSIVPVLSVLPPEFERAGMFTSPTLFDARVVAYLRSQGWFLVKWFEVTKNGLSGPEERTGVMTSPDGTETELYIR